MDRFHSQRGQLSLQILIFSTVAVILLTGYLSWSYAVSDSIIRATERFSALQIAEAGIDYYHWHLAHNPNDYQDGTGATGPYTHDYYDKNGNRIGQFILDITPPTTNSTVVTIQSTGLITSDPSISKIIKVKMGIPSFTKYAAAINDAVRFGQGTEVYGAIQSNNGIRFDGIAHNVVSSGLNSYDDPDHTGNNEFGVHTHVNIPPATGVNDTFRAAEAPPSTITNRTDVFLTGRQLSAPALNFAGITANLTQIKSDASSTGVYLAPSGARGYHIILKNNSTFDVYRVTTLASAPSGCSNVANQTGWGTWSIRTTGGETFVRNYPFPANNLIFVEDDLWIEGIIGNSDRLTIGAARFPDNPATRASITVNNNLTYTNYDGSNALALIAQNNFNTGLNSANILRIDGALIAQNGRAGRYYYNSSCGTNYRRSTITLYGSLMSYNRYGFAYTDGTGYATRNITYDPNLLYAPPPSFPLSASTYQIISWEELK